MSNDKKLTSVTLLKSTTYGFHEFYISMLNYTIGDKVYYNEHLKINKHISVIATEPIIPMTIRLNPIYFFQLNFSK